MRTNTVIGPMLQSYVAHDRQLVQASEIRDRLVKATDDGNTFAVIEGTREIRSHMRVFHPGMPELDDEGMEQLLTDVNRHAKEGTL